MPLCNSGLARLEEAKLKTKNRPLGGQYSVQRSWPASPKSFGETWTGPHQNLSFPPMAVVHQSPSEPHLCSRNPSPPPRFHGDAPPRDASSGLNRRAKGAKNPAPANPIAGVKCGALALLFAPSPPPRTSDDTFPTSSAASPVFSDKPIMRPASHTCAFASAPRCGGFRKPSTPGTGLCFIVLMSLSMLSCALFGCVPWLQNYFPLLVK